MIAARRFLDGFWIALVTFVLISTLVAMAFSVGGLTSANAVLGLIAGFIATAFVLWKNPLPERKTDPSSIALWNIAAAIAFVLFTLRAFLWLIFQKGEQIAVLSRNNLGDLPLHIQYIRFLSHGAPLWPVNPIHAHSTIGYPFGIDYFNALLDICGIPLWNALIVTGILGSLATGIALYRWGRAFGIAGFLFNGGAAGLAILQTGQWIDYQQTMDWKCLPLALFVTQRGFLYALPAGLLLLTHWRRAESDETAPHPFSTGAIESNSAEKTPLLPAWLEVAIYATMPLFHIHTFLFLSVVLGTLALLGKNRARHIRIGLASILPATIFVWLLTDGFHAGNQLAWQPGWMQGDHFTATYWLRNFGALPFFIAWLVFVLARKKERVPWLFVGPALLVFIATFFIRFSPWEWDNTKLMMWSYLILLPYLWNSVLKLTPVLVRITSCLLLFASGFISMCGGLGPTENGYDIADLPTTLSVQQTVEKLPIAAIFAAAPEHAHPLVFAGRRLALGYHGHMVGHGIPYEKEKRAMDDLMLGRDNWQAAAKQLGVRYLYWGPAEEKTWPASEKPWISSSELEATEAWGEIYRLP